MNKKSKITSIFIVFYTLLLLGGTVGVLGASQYNGTLSYDRIVWYRATLSAGTILDLDLVVPTGCDFDLYLTTSIVLADTLGGRHVPDIQLDKSINMDDADEAIDYTTSYSGIFMVAVHCHSGTGTFTLTSNIALEQFDPILEITIIVVIIILAIAVPVIAGYLIYRRRRSGKDEEFFDNFYEERNQA